MRPPSEIMSGSGSRFMAGGTDIVGVINEKIKDACPDKLVSLKGIGLEGITEDGGSLRIGAMTKLGDIEDSAVIKEKYGVLWEAAHQVLHSEIARSHHRRQYMSGAQMLVLQISG